MYVSRIELVRSVAIGATVGYKFSASLYQCNTVESTATDSSYFIAAVLHFYEPHYHTLIFASLNIDSTLDWAV